MKFIKTNNQSGIFHTVTLARPDVLNALNPEMIAGNHQGIQSCRPKIKQHESLWWKQKVKFSVQVRI
jgi:enoyl-CoA hydratase/carnithine racemase